MQDNVENYICLNHIFLTQQGEEQYRDAFFPSTTTSIPQTTATDPLTTTEAPPTTTEALTSAPQTTTGLRYKLFLVPSNDCYIS